MIQANEIEKNKSIKKAITIGEVYSIPLKCNLFMKNT